MLYVRQPWFVPAVVDHNIDFYKPLWYVWNKSECVKLRRGKWKQICSLYPQFSCCIFGSWNHDLDSIVWWLQTTSRMSGEFAIMPHTIYNPRFAVILIVMGVGGGIHWFSANILNLYKLNFTTQAARLASGTHDCNALSQASCRICY